MHGYTPMQIITINLPEIYNDTINDMVVLGKTPSRSEFIRASLREYLKDEISFFNHLKNRILTKEE